MVPEFRSVDTRLLISPPEIEGSLYTLSECFVQALIR